MSDALLQRLNEGALVLYIGREGIILADVEGNRFCVTVNAQVDFDARVIEDVSFDVVRQPAWPATWERDLRNLLATIMEPRMVEDWIRSARVRGLSYEDALLRAQDTVDRSYA